MHGQAWNLSCNSQLFQFVKRQLITQYHRERATYRWRILSPSITPHICFQATGLHRALLSLRRPIEQMKDSGVNKTKTNDLHVLIMASVLERFIFKISLKQTGADGLTVKYIQLYTGLCMNSPPISMLITALYVKCVADYQSSCQVSLSLWNNIPVAERTSQRTQFNECFDSLWVVNCFVFRWTHDYGLRSLQK